MSYSLWDCRVRHDFHFSFMLSELRQTEISYIIQIYHLYVESAKHNKCEYNKRNRLTAVETKLVVTCEETNRGRDYMGEED